MVINGELSVGELTAFVLYIAAFFQPIQQLVQTYNMYQAGKAALVKLRELLATDPSVVESPEAEPLPPVAGDIVFEGITFGYDGANPVLHDVDLQIAPGETVALVGPTGAGKSTLAKLVPRFYDPTAVECSSTVTTSASSTQVAPPPARRRPPRAVPVRRVDPGQRRLRPPRAPRTTSSTRRSTSSACAS